MMRIAILVLLQSALAANAFSMTASDSVSSRRAFMSKSLVAGSAFLAGGALGPQNAVAGPDILKTSDGKIKYAVLKGPRDKSSPQKGDIVAIEYTGYLTDGSIFDATHAEGKQNALMFELGGNAVIDGVRGLVRDVVSRRPSNLTAVFS